MTTKKSATVTALKKLPSRRSAAKKSPALKKPAATKTSKRTDKSAAKNLPKKAKKNIKVKVVRDSFTMPQNEYQKIAEIKAICLKSKVHVKKSEVLRAGLKVLGGLRNSQLKKVLGDLEKVKTGRPKKH